MEQDSTIGNERSMTIKHQLLRPIVYLILEMPASKLSYEDLAQRLENSCETITERITVVDDTPGNHEQLRHVIGIERWGQRRLRVALGEPFVLDELEGYKPSYAVKWPALQTEFRNTRHETIALARKLGKAKIDPSLKILHNSYGLLSPRGWLRHLDIHASTESKRIR